MSADPVLDELRAAVGASHVIVEPDVRAQYETDWTRRFTGTARAVVRPRSTPQVAAVLGVCARADAAVVPQGGNTGLVGGGVPRGGEVILSTRRLDQIGILDADNGEIVVGAGVVLGDVRRVAREAGWDVGVDLAARDSATIGGMVATNAGGEHVLRYGGMRNQVIGVEAVLAGGDVVGRVPALRKDNTGYHWAGVLAGSEGTLAVVTRVHLALVPALPERIAALAAFGDFAAAVRAAGRLRRGLESLLALETFFEDGLALVCRHGKLQRPFPEPWPVYLLVEAGSTGPPPDPERIAELLGEPGAGPTAVAMDDAGRARLWAYRDRHAEAINAEGVPHKLDVTLPHDLLVQFATVVRDAVTAVAPQARVVLFGHVGDGNLHVNVLDVAPDDVGVDRAVLGLVAALGGSISAEHGIGIAKRDSLALSRDAADVAAMWRVKQALDPRGILNPGVLLPDCAAKIGGASR